MDPYSSKALESHNAIFKHDMAVLEGVVLTDVDDGVYTLIASATQDSRFGCFTGSSGVG